MLQVEYQISFFYCPRTSYSDEKQCSNIRSLVYCFRPTAFILNTELDFWQRFIFIILVTTLAPQNPCCPSHYKQTKTKPVTNVLVWLMYGFHCQSLLTAEGWGFWGAVYLRWAVVSAHWTCPQRLPEPILDFCNVAMLLNTSRKIRQPIVLLPYRGLCSPPSHAWGSCWHNFENSGMSTFKEPFLVVEWGSSEVRNGKHAVSDLLCNVCSAAWETDINLLHMQMWSSESELCVHVLL